MKKINFVTFYEGRMIVSELSSVDANDNEIEAIIAALKAV